MILALSLIYFAVFRPPSPSSAAPIQSTGLDFYPRQSPCDIADLDKSNFNKNYRSSADIAWTCWLTVFACTWVSIHPNVRGFHSTWKQRVLQRVELMFWGIMAPELVVMWACRQWFGARAIREKIWAKKGYQAPTWWEWVIDSRAAGNSEILETAMSIPNWSLAHSHFLQMGGYMFEKDGIVLGVEACDERHPIEKEAIEALLRRPETEDEIEDRSKGDALAKTFVVLQTLWFILQCAARGSQGLVITELELTTLAYAALNGIMYFFWWNKPLDAQCPIVVPLSPSNQAGGNHSPNGSVEDAMDEDNTKMEESVTKAAGIPAFHGRTPIQPQPTFSEKLEEILKPLLGKKFQKKYKPFQTWPLPFRIVALFLLIVILLPINFIRRMGAILQQGAKSLPASSSSSPAPQGRVMYPTFYAFRPIETSEAKGINFYFDFLPPFIGSTLASMFGAIHCIAWSFQFPSQTNQLLWRISSLFICISPLSIDFTICFMWVIQHFGLDDNDRRAWSFVVELLVYTCVVLNSLSLFLYIPARCILLVLSFIEMAHLPQTAHQTVDWTGFLAHAG